MYDETYMIDVDGAFGPLCTYGFSWFLLYLDKFSVEKHCSSLLLRSWSFVF